MEFTLQGWVRYAGQLDDAAASGRRFARGAGAESGRRSLRCEKRSRAAHHGEGALARRRSHPRRGEEERHSRLSK